LGRMILATAMIEGVVNHARLTEICSDHPHDLSLALARLEREGMLLSQGQSRGKVYHLPGAVPVSPEQVFPLAFSSGKSEASSGSNGASSGSNVAASGSSEVVLDPAETLTVQGAMADTMRRDGDGCLLSPLLDAPILDDLQTLSAALRADLLGRAALPREKARLERQVMVEVILSVCEGRYVRLSVLAELLNRDPDGLRKGYLDTLVKEQRIRRAFPGTPTHELQSYRKAEEI
jgi:ATP-dependent DNA helicase RecG